MRTATLSEWTGAGFAIVVALAILALVYLFYGDPDRTERLRARYGPLSPLFMLLLLAVYAFHSVNDLLHDRWLSAALWFGTAAAWLGLFLWTRREWRGESDPDRLNTWFFPFMSLVCGAQMILHAERSEKLMAGIYGAAFAVMWISLVYSARRRRAA